MPHAARLGDASDHGGTVISASETVFADGLGVCRDGDLHSCPIPGHGVTAFTSGSTRSADGRGIVRTETDACGCGAKVVFSDHTVEITT